MDSDNNFRSQFREDDTIDIKRYISLLINNWYWFVIVFFISLSIAYAINRYSEKIYTVSATMIIKDDQKGGGFPVAESVLPGGDLLKSRQVLENEIGILKSYTLNKRVIDSLPDFSIIYIGIGRRNIAESRIYKTAPFVVITNDSVRQPQLKVFIRIKSESEYQLELDEISGFTKALRFGERFNEYGLDFRIELTEPENFIFDESVSNKYNFSFPSAVALANQYRSKLNISTINDDASLISLSTFGPSVAQEVDYLNKLMEIYLVRCKELKDEAADSTLSFIDDQLKIIHDSLRLAEDELLDFRNKNKLVDLSREAGLIQGRLERFETERTELVLQQKYYEYLKGYIEDKSGTSAIIQPSAMGVTDPQLVRLVEDLSRLRQQKRTLQMNLRTETAPLRIIDQNIDAVVSSLNEIIEGGMGTIRTGLEDVDRRIMAVEREVEKLPATEREMLGIQRKFDVNNTVYTFLLEKRAEAGIAKASTVADNRIIDYAYPFNSRRIKPKTKQNFMMALVAGLFVPLLLILMLDFFNNKILDKKDVEKGTNAPIIGYISHNAYKSELPLVERPGSTIAESFRSVRTNLKYFYGKTDKPVIAVSSTISAEGKTFISVNLAAIYAMLGKRVLLVGLDLRRPRIHNVLNMENPLGMSTYLSGQNSIDEIVQTTTVENLFYISAGPVPPNPAELIETEEMNRFIEKARADYDMVIIDTPPLAIVTDALLLAPYVDICILVVRQRYTSKNTLGLIQELYERKTFRRMAVLVNDISLSGYYGYGLRYGYTIGYSYGYNYYDSRVYGQYGSIDKTAQYYRE